MDIIQFKEEVKKSIEGITWGVPIEDLDKEAIVKKTVNEKLLIESTEIFSSKDEAKIFVGNVYDEIIKS